MKSTFLHALLALQNLKPGAVFLHDVHAQPSAFASAATLLNQHQR